MNRNSWKNGALITSLSLMLVALVPACPGTGTAVVECVTAEGKRLAERLGSELALLWDRDRSAWEQRARELAHQHGVAILQCIADALRASSLAASTHAQALEELARRI